MVHLISQLVLIVSLGFIHNSLAADNFELKILHNNDMHARFDEISATGTECTPKLKIEGKCYGGFARVSTILKQQKDASTIFLNAGDTYQGTAWYTVHKWEIVSELLNMLRPDVSTLGNHEFDDGPEGLAPFIKEAMFPIVSANLDFSKEPILSNLNISKSHVLTVRGVKIGVIGYLTNNIASISKPGRVIFEDVIESVKNEAKNLKAQGVHIIIGLSHVGYDEDKKIAAEVEDLDIIIGGHSHSFLYSGKYLPDSDKPLGSYPTVILQKSGRKVYIVQAYQMTKYMGFIKVIFDKNGEVISCVGNPILLDKSIEQDPKMVEAVDQFRPKLDALRKSPLGRSKVKLHHTDNCRTHECNLDNLIVDAMIESNVEEFDGKDGWTDAAVAFIASGSIKNSIEKSSDEDITMVDIKHAIPFENSISKVDLTGRQLLEILEHSVDALEKGIVDPAGQFLQFSGIKVTYDLSKPKGSRVVRHSLLVRCASCDVPIFERFNINKNYKVLTSDFLQTGGYKYTTLKDTAGILLSSTVESAVVNYIKRRGIIYPQLESRITFNEKKSHKNRNTNHHLYKMIISRQSTINETINFTL